MPELLFKDGQKKIVSYNTAAKIYQIQQGNEISEKIEELNKLNKIAKQVTHIDWNKV